MAFDARESELLFLLTSNNKRRCIAMIALVLCKKIMVNGQRVGIVTRNARRLFHALVIRYMRATVRNLIEVACSRRNWLDDNSFDH